MPRRVIPPGSRQRSIKMTTAKAVRGARNRPHRMIANVSSITDLVDGALYSGLYAGGRIWHVNSAGNGDSQTIQGAVDGALRGDVVAIDGSAEYDENVTITTSGLTFVGIGAPRSVRVTSVGTNSTAFTFNGVNDCAMYNLNVS